MIDPAGWLRLARGNAAAAPDVAGFMAAAWRRRRLALKTTSMLCLVGWSVLLAVPASGARSLGDGTTASAGHQATAALDEMRARLGADIAASRALRLQILNDLVATPATLGDGDAARPNPIHQRLRALRERQRQLILALERRSATLERGQPSHATGSSGRSRNQRSEALVVADRWVLAGLLPPVGLALGLAAAGWSGRRDGVIDGVAQLRIVTSFPVLAAIGCVVRSGRSRGRHDGPSES